jgi:hypothetical protein
MYDVPVPAYAAGLEALVIATVAVGRVGRGGWISTN